MLAKERLSNIFLFALMTLVALAQTASAGRGANFVLYNHHTGPAGKKEIMIMNDLGQDPDGSRYMAQMLMLEFAVTNKWENAFMIEGQSTVGEEGYNFTGFRMESHYRLFEYGATLNPMLYLEYEDLGEDTKYLMEVSGRTDAAEKHKPRPRERVVETRIIVGQDIGETMTLSANWITESDLDRQSRLSAMRWA